MAVARETLAHDKVLLDALQSRVNALSTDFANTSDPAQRAVVETNRKTALNEIERLTQDVEKQNKAILDIQEEARKANVPPGWLR
jgi:RNA polymerase-binding transcription factor DksA